MTARVRTTAALLGAALLLAAVSGCTGSSPGDSSARPATPSQTSAQATPTDRSPHGVLLSAQLALREARRGEFRAVLGEAHAKGAVFWAPKTVLQYRGDGDARRLMVLDTSAYVGGDPQTAARLGGPHWEKYSGGTHCPYSALIDRISPVVATTAAAAADSPLLLGEEKLLETTVQHYRVTLTAAQYAAAQTQLDQDRRQALETALGPGEVVLDLWLNDHDQVVQLRRAAAEVDTIGYSEYGSSAISVQGPAEADIAPESGAGLPLFP
ncbi:hypothetical protein [Kitasatospora sp. NPDC048407]|uniref:hypothetical protein n=1 Tax=Kitasatospora sp. NPDC048407 TaxID=3364051 RepID=UPI00370FE980